MRELEIVTADVIGEAGRAAREKPPAGSLCANCGAELHGPYCSACGQNADLHKRSIGRLVVEGVESILHLDGRVMRTLPDLFLHPGRLAKDFLEGRVARHVPPFRMFLVALLAWVFAAEFAAHNGTLAFVSASEAKQQMLQTPAGRAKAAANLRAEAVQERDTDLKDAANDLASDRSDPDEAKAMDKVMARYKEAVGRVQTRYQAALANADRVQSGQPTVFVADAAAGQDTQTQAWWAKKAATAGDPRVRWSKAWWIAQIRKAQANPEYYLSVMFTWGHRVAFLLLPIVGLTLAAAYFYKRRFFIYDHMVTSMNFLSFVFLANAPGFLMPSSDASAIWFFVVGLWTPINLYQTLRGGYASSRVGAALKAFFVWQVSFVSFFILVGGLMTFTLTQL
jgi:hypothetical protein